MSGFQSDLLTGMAVYLEEQGIGSWDTSAAYGSSDTGIVIGNVPQSPDRIITLDTYGVSDDPSQNDSVIGLQVRCRWGGQDPRPAKDLDDAVFALLHGKTHFTLGSGASAVTVVQCLRHSHGVLGQDANRRWSTVSNYYLWVLRPSTNRT